MSTKELVEHMRHLRVVLKSGEYTGVEIMEAWCALAQAADELDRLSSLGGKAMTAAPSEPKCACGQYAIKDAPAGHRTAQCPNLPAALLELAAIRKRHAAETRYYDRVNEPHTDAHADRAALLDHVEELERERDEARAAVPMPGGITVDHWKCETERDALRAELAEEKRERLKGWDAFYKLRASVAQRDYPGLTKQVKTAGDGLSKAIDAALKDTP